MAYILARKEADAFWQHRVEDRAGKVPLHRHRRLYQVRRRPQQRRPRSQEAAAAREAAAYARNAAAYSFEEVEASERKEKPTCQFPRILRGRRKRTLFERSRADWTVYESHGHVGGTEGE